MFLFQNVIYVAYILDVFWEKEKNIAKDGVFKLLTAGVNFSRKVQTEG